MVRFFFFVGYIMINRLMSMRNNLGNMLTHFYKSENFVNEFLLI